ncbi:MAG: NEAT domain-containing protein, partial [bacterium]|nr:NEAT domain-containing protein [bacterium]
MRKIKYKIAAVIATAIMMFTTVMEPIVPVFAAGITVTTKTGKIALSDGTYHVNISILKETTDAASAAAGYIDRDQVAFEVKGGIGKLKISYTTTMIGNLHQVIDGNKEVLTVVEDGEKKSVELTFTSLDEATYLGMNIDTGIIGVLPQTARVVLDQGSLTKDGVNVSPVPTATPDATTSPSVVPTATPDVTTSPSVMPTTAPSTGKVELADGTYSISYSVLKETADSTSNAGAYFDKENAVLTVKNKVAKLRVAYSDSMIGNLQQVVGDNKEVLTVVEHGAKKYVEVTLNSLSEVGYLYMEIDTNTSFGVMKHVVRLVLDETTLKKDGVIVPGGTTTPSPAPTATAKPTESPTNKPEQDNTQGLKDGVYETNAYLWHATSDQASMAGNAMESVVRVSVKNGKSTMYIYTREMSMGTIKAFLQELKVLSADGTYKNAKVEAYDSNKNPICFSFEIPAYTEYINVKVNPMVALMGNQDIDARIKFDYQAMKTVSGTVDLTQSPSSSTNQQPTTKPNATTKPTATVK